MGARFVGCQLDHLRTDAQDGALLRHPRQSLHRGGGIQIEQGTHQSRVGEQRKPTVGGKHLQPYAVIAVAALSPHGQPTLAGHDLMLGPVAAHPQLHQEGATGHPLEVAHRHLLGTGESGRTTYGLAGALGVEQVREGGQPTVGRQRRGTLR